MRLVPRLVCCLLVVGCGSRSIPPVERPLAEAEHPPIVIRAVTVIDVSNGARQTDRNVFIQRGRITAIAPDDGAAVPPDAIVVDAAGRFLIPGLWDMHTHSLNEWERALPLHLANGVTGIRDMATSMPMSEVRRLRERIAAGEVAGPRFVTGGPLIDGPNSFRDYLKVGSPEQARAAVDSLHGEGVDFIKVYEELPRAVFKAVVEAAGERALPVVGHVPIAFTDPAEAVGSMRSVEHVDHLMFVCTSNGPLVLSLIAEAESLNAAGDSAAAGDAFARADGLWRQRLTTYSPSACEAHGRWLRSHDTWFTPTLNLTFRSVTSVIAMPLDSVFADPTFRHVPADVRDQWRQRYETAAARSSGDRLARARDEQAGVLAAVRDLHRGGAGILAGTDGSAAFQVYGFNLHDELGWLVDAGLTPLEALQAATLNPARYLEREHEIGTIAVGAIADLVILDADPLLDVANTQAIHAVVAAGRFFSRADLDDLLESSLPGTR